MIVLQLMIDRIIVIGVSVIISFVTTIVITRLMSLLLITPRNEYEILSVAVTTTTTIPAIIPGIFLHPMMMSWINRKIVSRSMLC